MAFSHWASGVRGSKGHCRCPAQIFPFASCYGTGCSLLQLSLFPGTQPTFPEVNALTGGWGVDDLGTHRPATLPLGATGSLVQLCSQAPCGISYASVQSHPRSVPSPVPCASSPTSIPSTNQVDPSPCLSFGFWGI